MIWQQWKIEQNPQDQSTSVVEEIQSEEKDLPDVAITEPSQNKTKDENIGPSKNLKNIAGEEIALSNNELKIIIDTKGGTVKEAKLLKYFETTDLDSENIKLLDYQNDFYIAQSGLLHDKNLNKKNENKLAPNHHDLFKVKSKKDDSIILEWTNAKQDITVFKKIYLDNAGYKINIEHTIINKSKPIYTLLEY